MTKSVKRTLSTRLASSARPFGTVALALAVLAVLPEAVLADPHAGGAQAGAGAPVLNTALYGPTKPQKHYQCFHRTSDDRPSTDPDAKTLTVWLSVPQAAIATVNASGTASGPETGTLAITVTRDGIPVAHSQESRGTKAIVAHTGVGVPLVPGKQYKITAKPTVRNMTLGIFRMDVGVDGTC